MIKPLTCPQNRDRYSSVQIAGDSGSPFAPFLGINVGDHRGALLARLGQPWHVKHEGDVNVDLYEYNERNYSFEVDSHGRVSSIQILGTDGFPKHPKEAMPSLDWLLAALQGGGSTALTSLAADVEVYRGSGTVTFKHGALADLADTTTALARALFEGTTSVRSVLSDSTVRQKAKGAIRVWDKRPPGWVWKFEAPCPIGEIVFIVEAGDWRVWEVRYR